MKIKIKSLSSILVVNVGVLLFLLFITECGLRITGTKPGIIIQNRGVTDVDSLHLLTGFTSCEDGINRVDTSFRDEIHNIISAGRKITHDEINEQGKVIEVFSIANDFIECYNGQIENDFSKKISLIKKIPGAERSRLDQTYLEYSTSPINADGFRSIPFDSTLGKNNKILLLGDSFTWGHSASNKTNSFADILASKGWVVFNTGISGVDPVQYAAIAKKYIPLIKPDIVIINFYTGNDILYFHRKLKPFQLIHYPTNAGMLHSHPYGEFLSPDEALEVINLNRKLYPRNHFEKLCAQSATGTKIWLALRRLNYIQYNIPLPENHTTSIANNFQDAPVSEKPLVEIKDLTDSLGIGYILSVIKTESELQKTVDESHPKLFQELEFTTCKQLNSQHYKEDDHFNDEGHKVYAEYLNFLLGKMLNQPQ